MTTTIGQNSQIAATQTTRFPWSFLHGIDRVSQAQVRDLATKHGWSIRNGEPGELVAVKDGRQLRLPEAHPCYSPELSDELVQVAIDLQDIAPGRGAPGSAELAALLDDYRRCGLPTVSVGHRRGPFMPQIRTPMDGAPTMQSLDEDMARVERDRWAWAQPMYPRPVTKANREEAARFRENWQPRTKRGRAGAWHPSRHPSICMWAANSRDVRGKTVAWVAEYLLGLADQTNPRRTVSKAVDVGRRSWSALGAWPWAAIDQSDLDREWWSHDGAWAALREPAQRAAGFLDEL